MGRSRLLLLVLLCSFLAVSSLLLPGRCARPSAAADDNAEAVLDEPQKSTATDQSQGHGYGHHGGHGSQLEAGQTESSAVKPEGWYGGYYYGGGRGGYGGGYGGGRGWVPAQSKESSLSGYGYNNGGYGHGPSSGADDGRRHGNYYGGGSGHGGWAESQTEGVAGSNWYGGEYGHGGGQHHGGPGRGWPLHAHEEAQPEGYGYGGHHGGHHGGWSAESEEKLGGGGYYNYNYGPAGRGQDDSPHHP